MVYALIPICLLLMARLATMSIDLKDLRKAYSDLRKKYDSLTDEYL